MYLHLSASSSTSGFFSGSNKQLSNTLNASSALCSRGSLQPLVPTSSKAFVQLQKVHRIIHPVFRKVQHSFGNTSPETNHTSTLKGNSFSSSFFTSSSSDLGVALHSSWISGVMMMCSLMLTTRIMEKHKNHSPFIQKSARFTLDDKKINQSRFTSGFLGTKKVTWLSGAILVSKSCNLIGRKRSRDLAKPSWIGKWANAAIWLVESLF